MFELQTSCVPLDLVTARGCLYHEMTVVIEIRQLVYFSIDVCHPTDIPQTWSCNRFDCQSLSYTQNDLHCGGRPAAVAQQLGAHWRQIKSIHVHGITLGCAEAPPCQAISGHKLAVLATKHMIVLPGRDCRIV